MVGSIAFRSLTRRPSLQNVRLARGRSRPGSVHLHLTSGPIFSITSKRTMPPSTTNSSPTLTSAKHNHQEQKGYKQANRLRMALYGCIAVSFSVHFFVSICNLTWLPIITKRMPTDGNIYLQQIHRNSQQWCVQGGSQIYGQWISTPPHPGQTNKHIDKEVSIVQQHFLGELHPLLSPNSSLPRLFCPKPYIQIILTPDTSHSNLALNPRESM